MKASRIFAGIRICKLNTDISITYRDTPIIFVFTHVGRDDITVFSEMIKRHYTILSGDYESMHNRVEGFISMINGTIFFDMKSKEERILAEEKVVDILKSGDNILCCMEAAWNISPNEIVQELFPGMIRAAIKAKAVIICVGIERFNAKLYGINIAQKVFDPAPYLNQYRNEKTVVNIMRDEIRQYMAELKFQLYFHEKIQKEITIRRHDIGDYDKYEQKFKQDILKGWTFTEQIIEQKKYRNIDKPKYAYGYVKKKYAGLLNGIYDKNKLIELIRDIKDPVYPNCIHNELLRIAEQAICDKYL